MLGATMPMAAVDKHGDFGGRKNEVRPHVAQIWDASVYSVSVATTMQFLAQAKLRTSVS